jgi:DNA helicase HerA-like ATPase
VKPCALTSVAQPERKAEPLLLGSLLGSGPPAVPIPLEAKKLAKHTAILAQSGSGKSFFVGRLVEELLIKTTCKILVLDPNSDFVKANDVDSEVWESNIPDLLPQDETSERFARRWAGIEKLILTNQDIESSEHQPISVLWSSLDDLQAAAFLGIDPAEDAGHFWYLIAARDLTARRQGDIYTFQQFRQTATKLSAVAFDRENPDEDWWEVRSFQRFRQQVPQGAVSSFLSMLETIREWRSWAEDGSRTDMTDLLRGLLGDEDTYRFVAIDLQSLSLGEQRLVVEIALAAAWKRAREQQSRRFTDPEAWEKKRAPIFVVIDEAHNLAPAGGPERDSVREEVVRIAAEGRKYDLFVVVVTQSPRRIDPLVLSQCENLFLLRMTSEVDVEGLTQVLGFPPLAIARAATTFSVGDLLAAGGLVRHPLLLHAYGRRTTQGGASLGAGWTVGEEDN